MLSVALVSGFVVVFYRSEALDGENDTTTEKAVTTTKKTVTTTDKAATTTDQIDHPAEIRNM